MTFHSSNLGSLWGACNSGMSAITKNTSLFVYSDVRQCIHIHIANNASKFYPGRQRLAVYHAIYFVYDNIVIYTWYGLRRVIHNYICFLWSACFVYITIFWDVMNCSSYTTRVSAIVTITNICTVVQPRIAFSISNKTCPWFVWCCSLESIL